MVQGQRDTENNGTRRKQGRTRREPHGNERKRGQQREGQRQTTDTGTEIGGRFFILVFHDFWYFCDDCLYSVLLLLLLLLLLHLTSTSTSTSTVVDTVAGLEHKNYGTRARGHVCRCAGLHRVRKICPSGTPFNVVSTRCCLVCIGFVCLFIDFN